MVVMHYTPKRSAFHFLYHSEGHTYEKGTRNVFKKDKRRRIKKKKKKKNCYKSEKLISLFLILELCQFLRFKKKIKK